MALSKVLFSFRGRVPRLTFWIFNIVFTVVFTVAAVLAAAPSGSTSSGEPSPLFSLILPVLSLVFIVPYLAVTIKRCHDLDHSGWFMLWILVPAIGPFIYVINLGFMRGTVGDNPYGPDPGKAATAPVPA